MTISYVKPIDSGYLYTMRLSPASCDLQQSGVSQSLVLTPMKSAFSALQVKKTGANAYLVTLVLQDSVAEDTQVVFKLYDLTATAVVPQTFLTSPVLAMLAPYAHKVSTAVTATLAGSLAGTMALGASSVLWSIVSYQQFVIYFTYLNIKFPAQIDLLLSFITPHTWNILPNPFAWFTNKLYIKLQNLDDYNAQDYLPPASFPDYQDGTSLFIINGGQIIGFSLSALILLGVVLLFKKIPMLSENVILVYLKVNLRWNIIFRALIQQIGPLSLAIFLQLRVFNFDHIYTSLCGVLAILSSLYLLITCISIIRILRNRDMRHLETAYVRGQFGTLYEGLALTTPESKYYYISIMSRDVLMSLIITFGETLPLLQISVLIIYSIFLVYYVFKYVTFETKALNFINRTNQVLLLGVEICLLMLLFKFDSLLYYEITGWVIVSLLGLGLLIEVFYMIGLQLFGIKKLYGRVVSGIRYIRSLMTRKTNKAILKRIRVKRRDDNRALRIKRLEREAEGR